MEAVAYSTFRKDLRAYLDKTRDDAAPLLVTSKDPSANVVVMNAKKGQLRKLVKPASCMRGWLWESAKPGESLTRNLLRATVLPVRFMGASIQLAIRGGP